jgi:hypothetical protein
MLQRRPAEPEGMFEATARVEAHGSVPGVRVAESHATDGQPAARQAGSGGERIGRKISDLLPLPDKGADAEAPFIQSSF